MGRSKGEEAMTTYRLLWRDENGHIPKSTPIECSTVRQAIGIAEQQTGDYVGIEIWEGSRPVACCRNPNRGKDAGDDGRRKRWPLRASG